ncbi:MAG: helix-turn-helix domain-containing protein [Candidatus Kapabacteria bacterium]|nr:helix-turn-helix domain-containing protein [Candidatus Kapabacteria bacterium]
METDTDKQDLTIENLFGLLFKYPIYIDIFKSVRSWRDLESIISKNFNTFTWTYLNDDEAIHLFQRVVSYLFKAEEEIEKIENSKHYEFPTFCFYFDLIKSYMQNNLTGTVDKILYLNYVLKEYPNHIILRMNTLNKAMNEFVMEINSFDKFIAAFRKLKDIMKNRDMMFPEPPMRFEDRIINELKYLNLRLGFERSINSEHLTLESSSSKILRKVEELAEKLNEKDENKDEEDLMTISDTIKYLKISRSTLNRRIKEGIINYTVIGKKKYINKVELKKQENKILGKKKHK